MRIFFSFLLVILFFGFIFAGSASAQVIFINEFSAKSSPDWVEVYVEGVDKSLYQLRDSSASGNPKNLSTAVCNGNFCTVDWDDNLNNTGDTIKLVLIADPANPIDSRTYGGAGNVCIPEDGQSVGRVDNATVFERFSTHTKGLTNAGATVLPCPTPSPDPTTTPTGTPTPSPTPTPTPVPAKTPTPKATPTKSPTPRASTTPAPLNQETNDESILGLREGLQASSSPEPGSGSGRPSPFLAGGFVLVGGSLMAYGGYTFLKTRRAYTSRGE